ncbi:PREDICTED: uncharacterized protein LOC105144661 [Acromyrmex echinatior]|uniref:uncharacterized protein LOC105144661 n=1 Tax=Acromyrmex echinatior TaxID=103372 RepID=UPI000580ED9E|nr:PREDICTED: uncharacterized protein LOC105144661 [Acromyrmex echinatior]
MPKIAREGNVERGYQLSLDPISSRLKDESGTNVGYSRVHESSFLDPDDTPVRRRFRHPVPVAIFIRRDRTEVNDDSTESEKSVERKRRARRKRVRPATAEEREEKQLLCMEEGLERESE